MATNKSGGTNRRWIAQVTLRVVLQMRGTLRFGSPSQQ